MDEQDPRAAEGLGVVVLAVAALVLILSFARCSEHTRDSWVITKPEYFPRTAGEE